MAAESKISFFDSLIKIGQGFQEIFGIFGNAIGDALGLTAVKSDDNRSKVGEHFEKIGKGLQSTKDKLDGLAKDITSTPHADITGVEAVIQSASEVIAKLIGSVTKLASVTNDGVSIGENVSAAANAAVGAHKASVDTVIKEVKEIIETATSSGVNIDTGKEGAKVDNGNGPKALVAAANAQAAGDANKLAAEVSKADPWAMIDKIKNAKTKEGNLEAGDKGAGELATGTGVAGVNASTNADLAAAVALKAMTKDGKFSAKHDDEADKSAVKAAAASAVNKVLGVLDFIIKKTVSSQLDKVGEAVKGIQYSETTTESTESSATQPAAK
ncbi:variable large family protein (plasmid) [Borrelia turicatae 91E135]|nr:variable large family protein [Borrelia turicatae 91E135]